MWEPLLQAFPFPSTLGEVTLHPLSQACVFIYSSRGKWVFPLSCGVFLPPPLSQAFLLLVAGRVPPLPPSPARPGLFIYSSGKDIPSPTFGTQDAMASLLRVFFVVIAYYSVSLFFPGWWSVCPGGYADLARVVCGSTMSHLAHLVVCVFPSHLGTGVWQRPRGPPGFSI
jgi:hypothetical protein